MRGLLVIVGLSAGVLALPVTVSAQPTDYSAGKTPPQLFSGDCAACHQSPKGLSKDKDQRSLAGFLREHYTTRPENADALAAYLLGNPGTAAPIRNPIEAAEPKGRQPRGTPVSAPVSAPASAPTEQRREDDESPFQRIFRAIEPEPRDGSIVAPEPGEPPLAAKPEEPKGKPHNKPKPRTAAKPSAEPAGRAGKDAREESRETSKPRKAEPSADTAREAAKAEAAAKESAAREAAAREAAVKADAAEAAKAESAKAAAARVRAYATSGEVARPTEAAAPAAAEPAVTPPEPAPAGPAPAPAESEKPATPPG